MVLQLIDHGLRGVIKLGPDLNSEHVLPLGSTFVEQTDSREHICTGELISHHAEDEFVPEGLQERKRRFKVNLESASIFVDVVFPLGLNVVLEQTHAIDSDWHAFNLDTIMK